MPDDKHIPALRMVDVSKIFARKTLDEVKALDGVSLDINEGDYICMIGSNGSGKSTCLNVIAGVFPPERGGKILIKDNDVTNLPEYQHAKYVGRVWQDPSVGTCARLTIEENLSMAVLRGRTRGLHKAVSKSRRTSFKEALEPLGMGLENRLTAPVGTLSGGQRQALSLIMATITRPVVLLLDEHVAALDPKTAQIVMELTDMVVHRDNITALMVTHNMEIALRYGSRLVMMHKGKCIFDVAGARKAGLTIPDLMKAFEKEAGEMLHDDSTLLVSAAG
ncbi:MAG: ATP-binding cassette domain-containing protein [Actinomycetia bacterium]|nr:ATP-binding cassette domain-containing protein [Actinomycetes bacterium]